MVVQDKVEDFFAELDRVMVGVGYLRGDIGDC